MTIVWLRDVGNDEYECWVPCAKGDRGAMAFCPASLSNSNALSLQATREDERLACWKIAENERATAHVDKQAWLVAFDIANAIKMRGYPRAGAENAAPSEQRMECRLNSEFESRDGGQDPTRFSTQWEREDYERRKRGEPELGPR